MLTADGNGVESINGLFGYKCRIGGEQSSRNDSHRVASEDSEVGSDVVE